MGMNAELFLESLKELEEKKGISKESILQALKESIRKAYVKTLGGGDDADVRVEITEDPAQITMKYVRKVVEEVQDDYLEIELAEAKKVNKKAKVGDEFAQEVPVDELARITALTVKSVLRQKLAEAEKNALYETHKDKIGEMITGVVEKCDDRGAMINIGRTSIYLTRKDLIGEEMLETGAPVRLFVSDVSTGERGPMIHVSRSDPGFLRRLFEEEVREIYDGTVIIKSLARVAGVRSKVAVYSNDPNVDCVGACIGVNGSAIQKIVAQLGNGRDKEKIDIISYSPNDALFIIDAIRPAQVTHIHLNKDTKEAIVIVPEDQFSLAIGRKGANVRVACMLTGWKIDIKTPLDIPSYEVEFDSVEKVQEQEKIRQAQEKYANYLAQIKAQRSEETKVETGVEKAKPQQILDEEVKEEKPAKVEKASSKEEVKPVEVKEEKPEVTPTVVKTTTTLESLEKALESDKKKESFKATQKTSKRPHKITEEEVEREEPKEEKKVVPQMDIYSKDELEEFEKEDEEFFDEEYEDEDIDYDEFDKYYDDDNN